MVTNKHVKILVHLKYSITDEVFSTARQYTTILRTASWLLAHLTSPVRAGRNGDDVDVSVWIGTEKYHGIFTSMHVRDRFILRYSNKAATAVDWMVEWNGKQFENLMQYFDGSGVVLFAGTISIFDYQECLKPQTYCEQNLIWPTHEICWPVFPINYNFIASLLH